MYNRYVPSAGGYTRVVVDEERQGAAHVKREEHSAPKRHTQGTGGARPGGGRQDFFKTLSAPLSFLGAEDKNAGIAGILKSLHLEDLDSGDILLLLIILFIFLEGDNIELVITLGLMLLLGLGEDKKENQKE